MAKPNTTFSATTNDCCQLCHAKEHIASTCPKFVDTRPKCAKCGSGHKTDNCGLKCSFYFRLKHTKDRCWKKSAKGLCATINFLEVLVDDEEAFFLELNRIYGGDQHIFFRVKIPKKGLPITANLIEEQEEGIIEEEHREANMGAEVVVKI